MKANTMWDADRWNRIMRANVRGIFDAHVIGALALEQAYAERVDRMRAQVARLCPPPLYSTRGSR